MVRITSTAMLVETLRSCNLLEPSQLTALDRASSSSADPRGLARRLLHHGWLTPFQINHLFQGKAPELVLGSYLLLERLGEGGMGTVFKARHQKLGRTVALKVIRKDRLTDPETLRRFRREIEAVAQLSHPNIVLAYDAGEEQGTHFYVMEYVEGVSLSGWAKERGPLPLRPACEIMRQTALALQHVHDHGLVHRDVKPSNLFLSKGLGESSTAVVKLLDLGLARLLPVSQTAAESTAVTHVGRLVGTPDFISPEQAADAHRADIRSDLYSLGCTFYFILTGSVPFPGGTPIEKLFRHLTEEPMPVEQVGPAVHEEVAAIIRKLMAKHSADRFQTPAELVAALEDFLARAPVERTADTLPDWEMPGPPKESPLFDFDSSAPAAPRKRRPLPRPWLVGASCLLVGGSLLALLLGGTRSTPQSAGPAPAVSAPVPDRVYVRRPTWTETVLATLQANGLPTLQGRWHYIGPFDSPVEHGRFKGFRTAFPPEKEIDLAQTYPGKNGQAAGWKEFLNFAPGQVMDLRLFTENDAACVYLYHELEVAEPVSLPLSLGSDDTLTLWLNGERLLAREQMRGAAPDQDHVTLDLKPGKNRLLLKVCNANGAWAVYIMPQFPPNVERVFGDSLRRDFPGGRNGGR